MAATTQQKPKRFGYVKMPRVPFQRTEWAITFHGQYITFGFSEQSAKQLSETMEWIYALTFDLRESIDIAWTY